MKNVSKKNSLATLVSAAFVVIVVLSLLSTVLSYNRLKNFNSILSEITGNSLPEVSRASQVNNVLKEILYLTERLTNASNQASRRIAFDSLRKQETKLAQLIREFDSSILVNNQIKTAIKEIDDLNALVIDRIENDHLIQNQIDKAYNLQDKIIAQFKERNSNTNLFDETTMQIIQSVALSHKALNLYRLQPVRQLARKVKNNLDVVTTLVQKQDSILAPAIQVDIKKLKNLLLSDSGLFNLKIEQLQITGRSRGRGNFLHNLIVDISRLSEASFYEINESIVNEAQHTAKQIAEQVKWSISLAIFVVLLLIATIYFINRKIVARLLTLNENVIKRIQFQDSPINVEGNDEISDLARSFVYFSEKVEEQKQQLQKLSLTDDLTNLPNRRAMDERLAHDVHITNRGLRPLSIIMLDIDYFKPYNDFYGHVAGDECLKNVALGLKNIRQRESDFMARYGGEEFVMLLPTTDKEGAIKIAKRIKSVFEQLQLPHEKSKIAKHITVSIGIATFSESTISTVDNIINTADKALYHAKANGRNTYTHADDID